MIYECLGKKAAEPYYIEQMCLNIYSLEELLYFLKGNACLLDESIVNQKLIDFTGKQLGLDDLYDELKALRRKNRGIAEITCAIFNYAHYLSDEETERISKIIEGNSDVRPFVRRKSRADFFFQNKMYAAAGEEYAEALEECDDDDVKADIYRHLSAIYVKNFMMSEASGCLKKEWEITGDQKTLKYYLIALKEGASKEEYMKELMELDPPEPVPDEVEEFMEQTAQEAKRRSSELEKLAEDDRVGYIRRTEEIVTGLKNDYRRDF